MMNILLVNIESNNKSSYNAQAPLALLKLSTFYKGKGDNVEYIIAGQKPKNNPDVICFSTIFLFNIQKEIGYIRAYQKQYSNAKIRVGGISASLKPELFKRKLGDNVEIHIGLCDEIENMKPDYNIANINFSYGFTSRGCYKKCPWCVVPILEGKLYDNPNWTNYLGDNHKHFSAMDNNILKLGEDHMEKIMYEIHKRNMMIDFNQGLDCIMFDKNENFAKIFSKYQRNIKVLRFAWDSSAQDKFIDGTIEKIKRYNIITTERTTWYMLYGFKESINVYAERFQKIISHKKHAIKAMRYRDITTGAYGEYWNGLDKELSSAISAIAITGIISDNIGHLFGKNAKEFKQRIRAMNLLKKKLNRGIRAVEHKHIIQLAELL